MGNVRPFVAPKIAARFSRPAPKVARPAEWPRFRFATAQAALDAVQAIADKWAHLNEEELPVATVVQEEQKRESHHERLWQWYSEDHSRVRQQDEDVARMFGCTRATAQRARKMFMDVHGIEKLPTKAERVARYLREHPEAMNDPGVEIAARLGIAKSIVSNVRKRMRA